MGQSLASFRDLKGIGPATEARLHETGIYTWEALATAATALASVRGNGETVREIANAIAVRSTEAGEDPTSPGPSEDGERLEAFVLRMSLTVDGEPRRSEVTHVRTMAEQVWAGWRPDELAGFVREHGGIRSERAPRQEVPRETPREATPTPRSSRRRQNAPSRAPSSSDHVVVLDAGKTIGGADRDIKLVVTNTRSAKGDFGYRATLAARPLGRGENGEGWVRLASQAGTGSAKEELALGFRQVPLPPGIQRLRLRLEVNLPAPAKRPPALALAPA